MIFLMTLPALGSTSWEGAVRVTFNPGGSIRDFIQRFMEYDRDKTRVIIDGMCMSACTFVFHFVRPDRVCMTPRAVFAFHSAWREDENEKPVFAREATRMVWHMYPQWLRDMLLAKGWDGNGDKWQMDFIYLTYDEMRGRIQECPPGV